MSLYMSVLFQMGRQVPARFRGLIALPAAAGSKETVAPNDALKRHIEKTPVTIAVLMDFMNSPEKGVYKFRTGGPTLHDHRFNLVFFRIGEDRNNGADDF